jgi:hypothetical protein
VARADRAEIRIEALEADNPKVREENDLLRVENTRLKIDNQLLRDKTVAGKEAAPRPRGSKGDTRRVTHEEVLPANVPSGSHFKGYKDCLVRDLVVRAEMVRYRRECWVIPDGCTIIAPLPAGIKGGYGNLLPVFQCVRSDWWPVIA